MTLLLCVILVTNLFLFQRKTNITAMASCCWSIILQKVL